MSLMMIRIQFKKEHGGGLRYFKVLSTDLARFKEAMKDLDKQISLSTYNGTVHTFPPGSIRECSERPYDPNRTKRRP